MNDLGPTYTELCESSETLFIELTSGVQCSET